MDFPEGVVLLDSLGDLQPENTCPILVCGSHCGGSINLAKQVKNCNVSAVFLNNAGIGKNNAGVKGLAHYEAMNILACAVSHNSAEIGVAHDTWENGNISHINVIAEAAGIQIGDSVKNAVSKINTSLKISTSFPSHEYTNSHAANTAETSSSKVELKQQTQTQVDGIAITVTDSITFLNKNNSGDIVVCGSHGGVSAGEYAQKYHVKAVFFNDAGIGKNNAGIKSLHTLSTAGILACTVDCTSAEIFNGEDVLENGIISVQNQLAKDKGIVAKMSVKEAILLI